MQDCPSPVTISKKTSVSNTLRVNDACGKIHWSWLAMQDDKLIFTTNTVLFMKKGLLVEEHT